MPLKSKSAKQTSKKTAAPRKSPTSLCSFLETEEMKKRELLLIEEAKCFILGALFQRRAAEEALKVLQQLLTQDAEAIEEWNRRYSFLPVSQRIKLLRECGFPPNLGFGMKRNVQQPSPLSQQLNLSIVPNASDAQQVCTSNIEDKEEKVEKEK